VVVGARRARTHTRRTWRRPLGGSASAGTLGHKRPLLHKTFAAGPMFRHVPAPGSGELVLGRRRGSDQRLHTGNFLRAVRILSASLLAFAGQHQVPAPAFTFGAFPTPGKSPSLPSSTRRLANQCSMLLPSSWRNDCGYWLRRPSDLARARVVRRNLGPARSEGVRHGDGAATKVTADSSDPPSIFPGLAAKVG
jgi:hypothetical protein